MDYIHWEKNNMTRGMTGKHHSEKAKIKMSLAHQGKKLSKKTKLKMSLIRKGEKHNWGNKISASLKGNTNCLGRIISKTHRQKMSKAMKKYYKEHIVSETTKQKMRESNIKYRISGRIKNKDTSIEILIEQELIKNKIPYMKQVPIEGIALVDFLLPNKVIIQCDGDYWHSKEKNKGRDIAQDTVLTFKGYKVYRFWEHEIKKSVSKCLGKILHSEGEK